MKFLKRFDISVRHQTKHKGNRFQMIENQVLRHETAFKSILQRYQNAKGIKSNFSEDFKKIFIDSIQQFVRSHPSETRFLINRCMVKVEKSKGKESVEQQNLLFLASIYSKIEKVWERRWAGLPKQDQLKLMENLLEAVVCETRAILQMVEGDEQAKIFFSYNKFSSDEKKRNIQVLKQVLKQNLIQLPSLDSKRKDNAAMTEDSPRIVSFKEKLSRPLTENDISRLNSLREIYLLVKGLKKELIYYSSEIDETPNYFYLHSLINFLDKAIKLTFQVDSLKELNEEDRKKIDHYLNRSQDMIQLIKYKAYESGDELEWRVFLDKKNREIFVDSFLNLFPSQSHRRREEIWSNISSFIACLYTQGKMSEEVHAAQQSLPHLFLTKSQEIQLLQKSEYHSLPETDLSLPNKVHLIIIQTLVKCVEENINFPLEKISEWPISAFIQNFCKAYPLYGVKIQNSKEEKGKIVPQFPSKEEIEAFLNKYFTNYVLFLKREKINDFVLDVKSHFPHLWETCNKVELSQDLSLEEMVQISFRESLIKIFSERQDSHILTFRDSSIDENFKKDFEVIQNNLLSLIFVCREFNYFKINNEILVLFDKTFKEINDFVFRREIQLEISELLELKGYRSLKLKEGGSESDFYFGTKDGKEYAIKIFHQKTTILNDHILALKSFFEKWYQRSLGESLGARLSHPCLLPIVDIVVKDGMVAGVVSPCYDGDLVDFYKSNPKALFNFEFVQKGFRGLVDCLRYLHRQGIAHFDVKLENIFYQKCEKGESPFKMILGDLGFLYESKKDYSETGFRCGSPSYLPPEMQLTNLRPGIEADMWSFGVCIFTIFEGALPMKIAPEDMQTKVSTMMVHPVVKDFLCKCFEVDPAKRLTAAQAYDHVIFSVPPYKWSRMSI